MVTGAMAELEDNIRDLVARYQELIVEPKRILCTITQELHEDDFRTGLLQLPHHTELRIFASSFEQFYASRLRTDYFEGLYIGIQDDERTGEQYVRLVGREGGRAYLKDITSITVLSIPQKEY